MFQIRVYIGFYQKTTNHWFLLWAKEMAMALYVNVKWYVSIFWPRSGQNILKEMEPVIGKPQLKLVLKIIKELPKAKDQQTFLRCELRFEP